MKLPDEDTLNIMWDVAESSSLESGTHPHVIFAKLLYNKITKTQTNGETTDGSTTSQTTEKCLHLLF